ncbi:MAG TPA: N-formylglutamate amidohydrolase [Polyangiaceae bacterium]|jgi:predicted N-formylglutamate amidohydrolase|nr:N-formylglutamate amidohydrolase [Polyangiaceae bacterium]
MPLLDPEERPLTVEIVREQGASPFFLLCDHASRRLPRALGDLGLSDADLESHIAWDPGARDAALELSRRLDAPVALSGWSRLAIDCNRPLEAASSIPEITCEVPVPGNVGLDAAARAARTEELFRPYHAAIAGLLEARDARGLESIIVSVHSFTPSLYGKDRPWHVGVMYGKDARLGRALFEALSARPDLVVGDNEPYRVTDGSDYGVPVYAERAGRLGVLVELRQDLVSTAERAHALADIVASCLPEAAHRARGA